MEVMLFGVGHLVLVSNIQGNPFFQALTSSRRPARSPAFATVGVCPGSFEEKRSGPLSVPHGFLNLVSRRKDSELFLINERCFQKLQLHRPTASSACEATELHAQTDK